MDNFRKVIGLTLLAVVAVECTFAPRRGLNGQFYTGSAVGPLGLFRSSADNARIVNGALRGHPVYRSLALAFGDEFPSLRDEIIARANGGQRYGSGGSSGGYSGGSSSISQLLSGGSSSSSSSSSSTGGATSGLRAALRNNPFFNFQNYLSYDRGNQKKEYEDPYVRDNPLRAISGLFPSGGISSLLSGLGGSGGSGGGILSRITSLFSSLGGGGGSSSSSGSSGSGGIQAYLEAQAAKEAGSSASGSSSNFRITVDTPTRPPATKANDIEDDASASLAAALS